MSLSFQRSNLDLVGVGPLATGGVRPSEDHPVVLPPGTALGQHLRIERLVRVTEDRQLYLVNNVDPLWQHQKCWACGERFNPDLARCCTFCGAPLRERRFLATVRRQRGRRPAWESLLNLRLDHPALARPVAAFYRDQHAVTVYPYHGERLLLDQPSPLPPAVIVPIARGLAVALGALHDAGVRLERFGSDRIAIMPDGTARFHDLEARSILSPEDLAHHPDRPLLADVRHLCNLLMERADPEDGPLFAFLDEGRTGHHGPPRRFLAALERARGELVTATREPHHAGYTDLGLGRSRNEDTWGWRRVGEDTMLYVVADGMGGHDRGDVAARITVDLVLQLITRGLHDARRSEQGTEDLVREAVEQANAAVLDEGVALEGRMGATLVVLLLQPGGRAVLAWAGDARIYRMRQGRLERMTTDHSLVQAMVERGTLAPEDARSHPRANVVLTFVGQDAEIDVDVETHETTVGDRWLLCTDGVWGQVEEAQLAAHLSNWTEPRRCVQRLVREAYAAGGRDNATAVVVDVLD
jgi:PPM family protein phosphatase